MMTRPGATTAEIIWNHHVNILTWIGMGARKATVLRGHNGMSVDIYLGVGTRKRRLLVEVNGLDLYDVKIGRTNRKTMAWVIDAQATNIHADELDATIRRVYDTARADR